MPGDITADVTQLRVARAAYLNLPLDSYLQLLDWTERELRADKRGSIPAELAPIIDRLFIRSDTWVECVREFGVWFRRAAGRPVSQAEFAHRQQRHWLHGISKSHLAFGYRSSPSSAFDEPLAFAPRADRRKTPRSPACDGLTVANQPLCPQFVSQHSVS